MPRWKGFIGGYGKSQSVIGDVEDTVNMYVEKLGDGAQLLSVPGYRILNRVASVGMRGELFADGRFFTVIGAVLWEWDQDFMPTNRGAVALDGKPAQIIYDGKVGGQLGICAGGLVYSYDLASNVLAVTSLGAGFTHLAYAAGYGLAFNPTNGRTYVSALEDLTTWDAGTFFTRSLFPDPQRAMFVDQNNLVWVLGSDTFEVRYAGQSTGDQPFTPLQGLVGLQGIAAPYAYGTSAVGNAWLGNNPQGAGQLVVTTGGAPTSATPYSVSTATAAYMRDVGISDAEILIYQQEGHTFCNVAYPEAVKSWCYDMDAQSWTRRGRWNTGRADFDLWSPRCHAMAFGKHVIGDRTTGILAEMDTSLATELDGTGIRRVRVAPSIQNELRRFSVDRVTLLMDVGVGLQSGQGSAPAVMAEFSDNGGRTYDNEIQCGFGAPGEWGTLAYWDRLGLTTNFTMRMSCSEPVPFRVVDAFLNNLEGAR